jgi:hypothetical protein
MLGTATELQQSIETDKTDLHEAPRHQNAVLHACAKAWAVDSLCLPSRPRILGSMGPAPHRPI